MLYLGVMSRFILFKIDYASKAQAYVQSGHLRIFGDFFRRSHRAYVPCINTDFITTTLCPSFNTFINVHILKDEASRAGITVNLP